MTLAAIALVFMTIAYCWWRHTHRSGFQGFRGIPAIAFNQVEKEPSFVGRIESKAENVWPPAIDGNTGAPIPNARPTECIAIYLATTNRGKVCLYMAKPTFEDRVKISKLEIGKEYLFPDILEQLNLNSTR